MSDDQPATKREESKKPRMNPVKEMFILAALYLPMGFFLWFFFASFLMVPTARLSEWLMRGFFPAVFDRVVQLQFHLEIQTLIAMARRVEGQQVMLNLHVNPMIYAWGMALLFGLIMATPMTVKRRLLQLLIGYLVVSLVAVWGVFWEVWRDLAFLMGPEAASVVQQSALSPTAIALCYQLGYLMFPAVIPVATWILMNRPFLEEVVMTRQPLNQGRK